MPRYFFHIYDEQGALPDDEGMDLADDEAAKREGELSARELLKSVLTSGGLVDDRRVEVTDKTGTAVATFKLRDLVH